MKTTIAILLIVLTSLSLFGQTSTGFSVQGIARNAEKAALVDELLTFTFDIQDTDGTSYYSEDVDITTDPYGVFSHIIGTSGIKTGIFEEIPFHRTQMKLVITVSYDGDDVTLSNAPFQYTPYAKSAENGVPTGTIVAYAGEELDIPYGWVLCNGQDLNAVDNSQNLIDLIGNNAPDLRGMFLRATGTSPVNGEAGPALRETQQDGLEGHDHAINITTTSTGAHTHGYNDYYWHDSGDVSAYSTPSGDEVGQRLQTGRTTGSNGNHTHAVNGSSADTGTNETRPVNYGVNYIIKL